MQEGSLVQYVGGEDEKGRRLLQELNLPPLTKDIYYTVSRMGHTSTIKEALGLEEYDAIRAVSFAVILFKEVQPPMIISLEEILSEPKEKVTMRATKADYTYSIISHWHERNIIAIQDLNLGNMSVTNDIEAVVHEIGKREGIDPLIFMVVYKDSEDTWNGYNVRRDNIIPFSSPSIEECVLQYVEYQEKTPA